MNKLNIIICILILILILILTIFIYGYYTENFIINEQSNLLDNVNYIKPGLENENIKLNTLSDIYNLESSNTDPLIVDYSINNKKNNKFNTKTGQIQQDLNNSIQFANLYENINKKCSEGNGDSEGECLQKIQEFNNLIDKYSGNADLDCESDCKCDSEGIKKCTITNYASLSSDKKCPLHNSDGTYNIKNKCQYGEGDYVKDCVGKWDTCGWNDDNTKCYKTYNILEEKVFGEGCPHNEGDTESCNPGEGSCSVDCIGNWGECKDVDDLNTDEFKCQKKYTITQPALAGGEVCSIEDNATTPCNPGEGQCSRSCSGSFKPNNICSNTCRVKYDIDRPSIQGNLSQGKPCCIRKNASNMEMVPYGTTDYHDCINTNNDEYYRFNNNSDDDNSGGEGIYLRCNDKQDSCIYLPTKYYGEWLNSDNCDIQLYSITSDSKNCDYIPYEYRTKDEDKNKKQFRIQIQISRFSDKLVKPYNNLKLEVILYDKITWGNNTALDCFDGCNNNKWNNDDLDNIKDIIINGGNGEPYSLQFTLNKNNNINNPVNNLLYYFDKDLVLKMSEYLDSTNTLLIETVDETNYPQFTLRLNRKVNEIYPTDCILGEPICNYACSPLKSNEDYNYNYIQEQNTNGALCNWSFGKSCYAGNTNCRSNNAEIIDTDTYTIYKYTPYLRGTENNNPPTLANIGMQEDINNIINKNVFIVSGQDSITVEILLVGGGGGGAGGAGGDVSSGGGGGGVIYYQTHTLNPDTYYIEVGIGGGTGGNTMFTSNVLDDGEYYLIHYGTLKAGGGASGSAPPHAGSNGSAGFYPGIPNDEYGVPLKPFRRIYNNGSYFGNGPINNGDGSGSANGSSGGGGGGAGGNGGAGGSTRVGGPGINSDISGVIITYGGGGAGYFSGTTGIGNDGPGSGGNAGNVDENGTDGILIIKVLKTGPPQIIETDPQIIETDDYTLYIYTENGEFNLNHNNQCEVLLVGGGGNGANGSDTLGGGGGGGGEVIHHSDYVINTGTYEILVGSSNNSSIIKDNNENSLITARSGWAGDDSGASGDGSYSSGTAFNYDRGGGGGGGGGAGGDGHNAFGGIGGAGGDYITISISSYNNQKWGGGGGGGGTTSGSGGCGGGSSYSGSVCGDGGGGGNGGGWTTLTGGDGISNTGGGGGGGSPGGDGGSGGSGIVIIKVPKN